MRPVATITVATCFNVETKDFAKRTRAKRNFGNNVFLFFLLRKQDAAAVLFRFNPNNPAPRDVLSDP